MTRDEWHQAYHTARLVAGHRPPIVGFYMMGERGGRYFTRAADGGGLTRVARIASLLDLAAAARNCVFDHRHYLATARRLNRLPA